MAKILHDFNLELLNILKQLTATHTLIGFLPAYNLFWDRHYSGIPAPLENSIKVNTTGLSINTHRFKLNFTRTVFSAISIFFPASYYKKMSKIDFRPSVKIILKFVIHITRIILRINQSYSEQNQLTFNVTIRDRNVANLRLQNHIVILNSPLYHPSQSYKLKTNKYICMLI